MQLLRSQATAVIEVCSMRRLGAAEPGVDVARCQLALRAVAWSGMSREVMQALVGQRHSRGTLMQERKSGGQVARACALRFEWLLVCGGALVRREAFRANFVRFSFDYLGVRGIDVLEGRLRCHGYECSHACGAMPRGVARETSGKHVDRRTKSRDITNIAVLRYLQVAQCAVVAHMRRITTLQQCALDSANHAQTHAASTGKLDAEEHMCLRAWYTHSDISVASTSAC